VAFGNKIKKVAERKVDLTPSLSLVKAFLPFNVTQTK
jgi:hypothetical protein